MSCYVNKSDATDSLKSQVLSFEFAVKSNKEEGDELYQQSMLVLSGAKSDLDYLMHHLKDKHYQSAKDNIYYPWDTARGDLKKSFKKQGFTGIEENHPQLLDFLAEINSNNSSNLDDWKIIRNQKVFENIKYTFKQFFHTL